MRFLALMFALLQPQISLADKLPGPVTDDAYRAVNLDEAKLGQLLFYDPILSGNRSVSCATCHHPRHATSDGLSLGLGDGGTGLGPDRRVDPMNLPEQRIPRNSPALFNLGAKEFTVLFHDGRIAVDPDKPGGLRTPLGADMTSGFSSLLSAQTMFPVLSADEMAGHYGENDVSQRVRQGLLTGPDGAWDVIARRVAGLGPYADQFVAIYPDIQAPDDIGFTDVSNAIAAFMEFEWRSDGSPFDAYLRDEGDLAVDAQTGLSLFYGEAGCSGCHSGPFQTDHDFHAMAAPQIGPGKAARFETHARDEGRFRVTGDPADRFAFRTPSLRNVALTGPYGHAGAHRNLADFVRDHAAPVAGLGQFDSAQLVLPALEVDDLRIMTDQAEIASISAAVDIADRTISEDELSAIIAFLHTLTDPVVQAGRLGTPLAVPSGLTVQR